MPRCGLAGVTVRSYIFRIDSDDRSLYIPTARGRERQSIGKMHLTTSYGLNCPVARTLDIIGERWTLLILRDLFLSNARRFQDFEVSLPGISPTTLSARLKVLEDNGIIERRFYEKHPPRAEYLLTPKGRALGPVMKALRNWGSQY